MGEDISSITISFSANGNTQYQKQVVMIRGDYAGIITIAGKDEAEVQSLLESYTKAE